MTEHRGTAVRDEAAQIDAVAGARELTEYQEKVVEEVNEAIRVAYDRLMDTGVLTSEMPVGRIQWVHISNVRANDYNPNAVASHEMRLLHTSVSEDGYTQPVVAVEDDEHPGRFVIVDGYHRYTTMRRFADIASQTGNYLPLAVIDKPIADRIASTVRHNRARGKHSVAGMSSLVFQMLMAGEDDATICNKIGLEAEELARLKHVTGYSKLYKDADYSRATLTKTQMNERAAYAREHRGEKIEDV